MRNSICMSRYQIWIKSNNRFLRNEYFKIRRFITHYKSYYFKSSASKISSTEVGTTDGVALVTRFQLMLASLGVESSEGVGHWERKNTCESGYPGWACWPLHIWWLYIAKLVEWGAQWEWTLMFYLVLTGPAWPPLRSSGMLARSVFCAEYVILIFQVTHVPRGSVNSCLYIYIVLILPVVPNLFTVTILLLFIEYYHVDVYYLYLCNLPLLLLPTHIVHCKMGM